MKMISSALFACLIVLATMATQVHGGGQPLAMTLAGSGFTDQGVYVVFTIMANVENGLITGMIDSPNNTVSTTPPNVLEFITLPIASIVAAVPGMYDNVVNSDFPYVSNQGFVFNDTAIPPNSYNVHNDGSQNLQLGNPYATDDTDITNFYAQFDGTSSTSPALTPAGCFADYEVGVPGNDKPTNDDDWTKGTYPQRAFPKATIDDAMTVDLCGFLAAAAGFNIFGVENSRECWFGNDDFTNAERFGPATTCNLPCPGNPDEMCGGATGAINIFNVPG